MFVLAWRQALQSLFGLAGFVGGVIVAAFGSTWSPSMMSGNTWHDVLLRSAMGGAAGCFTIFLGYLVFVAPWKAWNSIRPLQIKVTSQVSNPSIVQAVIDKHTVSIEVKNRSSLQSIFCTVEVLEAPALSGIALPWQIYSGNIPIGDKHNVILAYWFFRKDNRETDAIRILAEHTGSFAESSMIQIPQNGAIICLGVRSPDLPEHKIWCHVWVDQASKKLCLEKVNG
jgi:hypothetical protein